MMLSRLYQMSGRLLKSTISGIWSLVTVIPKGRGWRETGDDFKDKALVRITWLHMTLKVTLNVTQMLWNLFI